MTQTVLLGDICRINPNTPLKKGSISKFVSMDKLDPFKRKIGDNEEREYRGGSKFINGDTLLARITPCLENGKTAYVDILADGEVGAGSTEFIVLRAIDGVTDSDYLYYLSISPDFRNYAIQAMIGTSGRQRVQNDVLARYAFELPDLVTQQKVGQELRTIDEKIELNRQMNETLEQMGQALFRHYFIDNPEAEKWEEKTLGDILDLRGGLSYKASFLSNRIVDMPMVTMGCVSGRDRINLDALKRYKGEYKDQHILNVGDIFIATRDVTQDRVLIGSPAIIPESLGQAICATNLYKVVLKENVSTEFLYQLMRTKQYREQIIAHAKGSTIVMLTKDSVLDYKFKIAFSSISYTDYIQKAEKIRQLIDKNSEQIQTLTALRDTLLPRLIDGKLKI